MIIFSIILLSLFSVTKSTKLDSKTIYVVASLYYEQKICTGEAEVYIALPIGNCITFLGDISPIYFSISTGEIIAHSCYDTSCTGTYSLSFSHYIFYFHISILPFTLPLSSFLPYFFFFSSFFSTSFFSPFLLLILLIFVFEVNCTSIPMPKDACYSFNDDKKRGDNTIVPFNPFQAITKHYYNYNNNNNNKRESDSSSISDDEVAFELEVYTSFPTKITKDTEILGIF